MRLQASLLRRMEVAVCSLAAAISFGPSIASASVPPAALYYLQGHDVRRISLADLRETTVLTLPTAVDPADVRAACGRVLWVDRNGLVPKLLAWDGATTKRIHLERHRSRDLGRIGAEYDEHGELAGIASDTEDRYFEDLLLSPDGSRVAWNINVATDLSPADSGTAHVRHVIDWADIEAKGSRRALEQRFDVHGLFADHAESRRLLRWSLVDPAWIFFTRFEAGQLVSKHEGLFRCNLISGVVKTVDASIDQVLGLSDDERWVAHTPDDESCCGGINETNNRVLVKDLRTGKESVVFDEWGEFQNAVIEPDEGRTGEDYSLVGASFSPDGRRLAITVRRWTTVPGTPSRLMTTVRDVASGGRSDFREGRCVLGWRDDHRVLLGECRAPESEVHVSGSVSVLDADDDTETALPLKDVTPLGLGDREAPRQ